MTPAFSFQGGKARIREVLVGFFPKVGGRYIELFAGRGNVFFEAVLRCHYKSWELYDRDASFLEALKIADLNELPDSVPKSDFAEYAESHETIAKVLEPAISFSGKGYDFGYQKERYNYGSYFMKCCEAQRLLANTSITSAHWAGFKFHDLKSEDFLYLDPPYYQTEGPYPNIDHLALLKILNGLPCKWALSGYQDMLYSRNLKFKRLYSFDRNAEMKGSLAGFRNQVEETLWMNYD